MAEDLRTWARRAAGLPTGDLDHDQTQQVERLTEHADDEPRTTYRGAHDLFDRPTTKDTSDAP